MKTQKSIHRFGPNTPIMTDLEMDGSVKSYGLGKQLCSRCDITEGNIGGLINDIHLI